MVKKLGAFMLGPKTHTTMSIATFVIVIISVVGFSISVGGWVESIENTNEQVEKNTTRIEIMQPDLVEIKTDLKWIRAKLDED